MKMYAAVCSLVALENLLKLTSAQPIVEHKQTLQPCSYSSPDAFGPT